MADSLEEMFAKQLNNPKETLGQQYQYLRDMNRVPTMEWSTRLPLGHNGNYNGWENRIRINLLAENAKNTLAHELQHAVNNIMDGQRYTTEKKFSMSPDERRFVEGYKKLTEQTKLPMPGLDRYRRSPSESQAFGVANSNYPYSGNYEGSSHLDPTLATEQAVLLDLANRALKSDNAPAKAAPKTDPIDDMINAGSDKLKQFGTWVNKYFQK